MTITHIQNEYCYVCTTRKSAQSHHCIPQNMNPRNNVIVRICGKCHDKINTQDVQSLQKYIYKIAKDIERSIARLNYISKNLKEVKEDGI